MIINMHKYLIWGSKSEVDQFFFLAQRAGFIEFIGLAHKKALELPDNAKKILAAIKIAKNHFIHPKEAPHLEPLEIADSILSVQALLEKLREEQRLLQADIARIAIFGDFSKADIEEIEREGKRVFQFYCMKSDLARELSLPENLIYSGTEYDLDYFVGIHKQKTQYPKMIEIVIDRPVGELKSRLREVREEISRAESDLRLFCNAIGDLENGLNECLNRHTLELARHDASTRLEQTVFAIEAWVPATKRGALSGLLSGLSVDCEEISIDPSDRVPTCVENRGIPRLGEDLIYIYDVPAPTDIDPSGWILWFFALFFAMIISDAGYGMIFLLIALFLKWKMPRDAAQPLKRFCKLFTILSVACIVWGAATASFFGLEIGPENPLRKVSLIHSLATKKAAYHLQEKDDVFESFAKDYPLSAQALDGNDFLLKTAYSKEGRVKYKALEDFNNNILLELSLVIGIVHLSLSFLRWVRRNPAGLGWILFMLGGYLYFPVYLEATTMLNFTGLVAKSTAKTMGLQLLAIGPFVVFVASILEGKKWMSLLELTNGIQVFSDILSYLRLYALALAGMVMADTVNTTLGIELGWVGTFFVILFGHFINIGLSAMSATIHGLRLNFLEWYRYCFEGGGRLFNPLRIRKVK